MQVGNTALDIDQMHVYGPLRPELTMGPVQRNAAAAAVFDPVSGPQAQNDAISTVTRGFLTWYVLGGLGLLAFTLASAGGAAGIRTLVVLRRQSRAHGGEHDPLHEIVSYCVRAARRMTVIALVAAVLAWLVSGASPSAGPCRACAASPHWPSSWAPTTSPPTRSARRSPASTAPSSATPARRGWAGRRCPTAPPTTWPASAAPTPSRPRSAT
ncbi:hypothetical protein BJF90_35470 [Pseudonocardia sp. CNS-004]|nr:hypothetical protein BJF90_35470 [Pseudonocardia sp. CNS-004]